MTDFTALSIEQVIYLHERIIGLAGGTQGVRDYTLLHSALERCKVTFGGEDLYPTTLEKAAALMHSVTMNHAFLDGNKRTAWQVTKRFLYTNEFKIVCSQDEIIEFCLAVDNKGWEVGDILRWLKSHTKKIRMR